jgi:PTH1 family peptidyl-tRNA hydrolase
MVVTDDLDLPFGKLRLRAQGGPGTHNGMRSILDSLASDQFPRLRVGIGQAGTDAARYVLARFRPEEQADIEITAAQAADAIEAWIAGEELVPLMTRVHSR